MTIPKPITLEIKLSYKQAFVLIQQLVKEVEDITKDEEKEE